MRSGVVRFADAAVVRCRGVRLHHGGRDPFEAGDLPSASRVHQFAVQTTRVPPVGSRRLGPKRGSATSGLNPVPNVWCLA